MVFKKTLFLLLLLLVQQISLTFGQLLSGDHDHHHHSLLSDKATLLAFRRTIISDPRSTLSNWDVAFDVCNFTGVRCSPLHHRVVQLHLNGIDIGGPLSPFIANLTGLRSLHLSDNHLFGHIPPEFASLRHLHNLRLNGNILQGLIPDSLSHLSKLKDFRLEQNNLTGTIPASIFSNCTFLRYVDLSNNSFTGKIPAEIGNPLKLWNLNLFLNFFSGKLPVSLSNSSLLYSLDLENNCLSGELPSEVVVKLQDIHYLHLSYNSMVSHDGNTNLKPFFTSLANCTHLVELELAALGLGGRLPETIGQLGTNLSIIHLEDNQIFGAIPQNVANLSYLTLLNLSSNLLNETIPGELSHLEILEQLILSNNSLSGAIPATLGQITSMGLLDLSKNKLFGEIPITLGNLIRLNYLFLNDNLLSGKIPPSLGWCKDLHKLDLSYNRLTGRIPPEISSLSEIRIFLNLSHNFLQGPLPVELHKMEAIQEIDLSSNNLTGSIFPLLSSCISVKLINFSHNSLQGQLPDSLGDLQNLESFDLSNNSLSGKIPNSLNKCTSLTLLNLSYNDFDGSIPTGGIFNSVTYLSFLGNLHLCGSVSAMGNCQNRKNWSHSLIFLIVMPTTISALAFLSTICCAIRFRCIKRIISSRNDELPSGSTPELKHNFPRITYSELSEATEGFDPSRLIGSGSYGHVYKGVLKDGTDIAVKVLQLQTGNSTKSFNRECQVLKRIRHRNLIRIITACSLPDFKALVLPYMANGSLETHLHPHLEMGLGSRSSDLSLIQRVNICSDISQGMAYLHHHSPVRVIHCDMKPSNVLLNDDMTALVSDFGIARLVVTVGVGNVGAVENLGNSTANMLHGSIGYIAPEYGFGSSTSTKGDVYSFGILVLEMVTRKRPTDEMFVGGLNLHKWVKIHYHGRVEKVIDSSLLRAARDQPAEVKKMWEVAIGELIELGILCTQDSPSTRPTMLDAADDLDRLKRYLDGDTTATFASSLGISSSTLDED